MLIFVAYNHPVLVIQIPAWLHNANSWIAADTVAPELVAANNEPRQKPCAILVSRRTVQAIMQSRNAILVYEAGDRTFFDEDERVRLHSRKAFQAMKHRAAKPWNRSRGVIVMR